eukprot:11188697-Lingulodinium_polyedra.AAC.1
MVVETLPPATRNNCRGNAPWAERELRGHGINPREEAWVVDIDAIAMFRNMNKIAPRAWRGRARERANVGPRPTGAEGH